MKTRAEKKASPDHRMTLVSDYLDLTKPRITSMVLVTAAIGYFLAGPESVDLGFLLIVLLGTGLVSASGATLNHVWERDTDRMMQRTADRPIPSGRVAARHALAFGAALGIAGVATLLAVAPPVVALLGVAAFVGYVLIYTPLKRRSPIATLVGAVPGAIPPMMGAAAVSGRIDSAAWVLFGLLFFWQLPHFLAIAWLCRADYAAAGMPMLPVVRPDGKTTARHALFYALALVPVSLMPTWLGMAGTTYFLGALVLGMALIVFCVLFSFSHSTPAARNLLLASVVYLPAVLAVMLLDRIV